MCVVLVTIWEQLYFTGVFLWSHQSVEQKKTEVAVLRCVFTHIHVFFHREKVNVLWLKHNISLLGMIRSWNPILCYTTVLFRDFTKANISSNWFTRKETMLVIPPNPVQLTHRISDNVRTVRTCVWMCECIIFTRNQANPPYTYTSLCSHIASWKSYSSRSRQASWFGLVFQWWFKVDAHNTKNNHLLRRARSSQLGRLCSTGWRSLNLSSLCWLLQKVHLICS